MRRLVPLVPAWLVGAWVLATADVWRTEPGDDGTACSMGWLLLGTLIASTILYHGAAFFGHRLAVVSSATSTVGLGAPTDAQTSFGAGLVRVSVLVGLYSVVITAASAAMCGVANASPP